MHMYIYIRTYVCMRVYSHFTMTEHVIRHTVFILKPSTYPAILLYMDDKCNNKNDKDDDDDDDDERMSHSVC